MLREEIRKKTMILSAAAVLLAGILILAGSPDEAYAASANSGKVVITSSNGAVVRAKPSIHSSKKTVLGHGKKVSVSYVKFVASKSTKSKYRWYYASQYHGYIRGDLVRLSTSSKTGKTTTAVFFRKGAGTSFREIRLLAKGKTVKVLLKAYAKDGRKWYYSKVGSVSGYIAADYIKIGSSSSRTGITKSTKTSNTETNVTSGFPASYRTKLRALKKAHPNWSFVAINTGLDWSDAVDKMTASAGNNTIYTSFPYSYRSVRKGCYNYLKHYYVGKDGKYFVAASKKAVKYYMDPRNWLHSKTVFMFEDHSYHPSYQTKAAVQTILNRNSVMKKYASTFMAAGKKYDVSPIYLASKCIQELGSYTSMVNGHTFKVNGKTYKGCYNVFNIGAYDSANGGAKSGLVYAKKQGWTSVTKAIYGGTKYLKSAYMGNRQNSAYLEHFNVRNGLSAVGTHEYMTAVYTPRSMAVTEYEQFKDYNILNKKIVFYIPVYKNMPKKACSAPSSSWSKDNNFYLKTLKAGSKTLISSKSLNYNKSFTVTTSSSSIKIQAAAASCTAAKVYGTGTKKLKSGTNTIYVKCKASSGEVRTYKITVIRR